MNILLIDDSTEILSSVTGYLEGCGHDVVTAENGSNAIEILKGLKFDAVVCDFEMPTPGYQVLSEYRKLYPEDDHRFTFFSGADPLVLKEFGVNVIEKKRMGGLAAFLRGLTNDD